MKKFILISIIVFFIATVTVSYQVMKKGKSNLSLKDDTVIVRTSTNLIRYDRPAKFFFFNSFYGFREIRKNVSENDIDMKEYKFSSRNPFYTYQNYLVTVSENEIGVIHLNTKKMIFRQSVDDRIHGISGYGKSCFIMTGSRGSEEGALYRLDLGSVTLTKLISEEKVPNQLYLSKDQRLFGLNSNYLMKYDNKNRRFNKVIQFQPQSYQFVIHKNKAYLLVEHSNEIVVVDLKSRTVTKKTIGDELYLQDIEVMNDNVYIAGFKDKGEYFVNIVGYLKRSNKAFFIKELGDSNEEGLIREIE